MSSNYPEGSMRGSGIYSESWSGKMDCDNCDKTVEVDGETNDWNTVVYAECPECGAELEKELDTEPDPDDDYDWQQDQQLLD